MLAHAAVAASSNYLFSSCLLPSHHPEIPNNVPELSRHSISRRGRKEWIAIAQLKE